MAQFDVYHNPSKTSKNYYPFLVDIQCSFISEIATRIVVPLGKRSAFGNEAMKGLTPEVTYEGEKLLLLIPQISSIPAKQLKKPIGSLSHLRDQIIGALDFAVTGI